MAAFQYTQLVETHFKWIFLRGNVYFDSNATEVCPNGNKL